MSRFRMDDHDTSDKEFAIHNDKITMVVDYDDVNHPVVEEEAQRILRVLNLESDTGELRVHRPVGDDVFFYGDLHGDYCCVTKRYLNDLIVRAAGVQP